MLVLLLAAITTQAPPWGTGESRGEDLVVSMVTFSPGDDLPEWWGHSAALVEDRRLNQARVYNYGMFGFSTGFVHKFVQGRLEFWVADSPAVRSFFDYYARDDRDVRVQELNLLPEQAVVLARALADNVLPENRDYLYHHYNDNCSTRPRDLIDRAFSGQLHAFEKAPARMSLRHHTRRYSRVFPPMSLILDYLQNDTLDRQITKAEEAFLPDELERQLDQLEVDRPDGTRVKAVARKWYYHQTKTRKPVSEEPPNWSAQLALFSFGFGGLGLWLTRQSRTKKWARVSGGLLHMLFGLVWGSLGVFLFIVGIATNHEVAHRNESLSLINPITFLALPAGFLWLKGSPRGERWLRWVWTGVAATSVLGVLLKVLPMFDQNTWNLVTMALPLNVMWALGFWWLAREPELTKSAGAR